MSEVEAPAMLAFGQSDVRERMGRVLAACREGERIEGEAKVPTVTILIEFPDKEAARAWHSDPEYQPLIDLRLTGSRAETLLFNGL